MKVALDLDKVKNIINEIFQKLVRSQWLSIRIEWNKPYQLEERRVIAKIVANFP